MYRFPWYLTLVSTNHASSTRACWIVIYLLDGAIKRLNNRARILKLLVGKKSELILIELLGVLEKVCLISSLLPPLSNTARNC